MFDYIMSVGRTPQITQDVSINSYSAYNDDLCQGGTLTNTYSTNGTGTISGDMNNIINPNFTDVLPIFTATSNEPITQTVLIDLKRRVGVGKHFTYIDMSRTGSANPTVKITISGSDDNNTFFQIYTKTVTAGSGTVSMSVRQSDFGIYKFFRYYKILCEMYGGTTDSSTISWGSLRLFPDYTQY